MSEEPSLTFDLGIAQVTLNAELNDQSWHQAGLQNSVILFHHASDTLVPGLSELTVFIFSRMQLWIILCCQRPFHQPIYIRVVWGN